MDCDRNESSSGFLDGMDEIDIALEAGWDGDAYYLMISKRTIQVYFHMIGTITTPCDSEERSKVESVNEMGKTKIQGTSERPE